MSAVGSGVAGVSDQWRGRPRYSRLLGGVLWGQLFGFLGLYAVGAVLAVLALAGIGFNDLSLYLPWRLEGAWSVAADVGWGTLVAAFIGRLVRVAVRNRTGVTLAWEWCAVAVAIGGYGSMLIGHNNGARVLLAVVVTPALVSMLGFESSGAPRPFVRHVGLPGRRGVLILAGAALLLVGPYSVLHPFVADGSGGSVPLGYTSSASGDVYQVPVGTRVRATVGLAGGRLGLTVTGARLLGSTSALRTDVLAVSANNPAVSTPFSLGLPLKLHAAQSLWVTYTVALSRCPTTAASVDRVRISYRVLGLALSETVNLQHAVRLTCTGPAFATPTLPAPVVRHRA